LEGIEKQEHLDQVSERLIFLHLSFPFSLLWYSFAKIASCCQEKNMYLHIVHYSHSV